MNDQLSLPSLRMTPGGGKTSVCCVPVPLRVIYLLYRSYIRPVLFTLHSRDYFTCFFVHSIGCGLLASYILYTLYLLKTHISCKKLAIFDFINISNSSPFSTISPQRIMINDYNLVLPSHHVTVTPYIIIRSFRILYGKTQCTRKIPSILPK